VLADPGLVRFLGEQGICRNQRYYPPAKPVLPSDDLYAVGVVLWEMTSGVSEMVSGRDRVRLDGQMLTFLLRSELPIAKVICRAVAEDPEQRYPNAEEMLQDLETLAARLVPESGTPSALYNLPKLRLLRTNGGLPPPFPEPDST
jgi:serine/threonine protein kinase